MVFDEYNDKLLWLMMAGDNKNRENLAYFIGIIPKEIYDYFNKMIINFNEKSGDFFYDERRCSSISKRVVTVDRIVYDVSAYCDGDLHLKLWRWKGIYIEEQFELVLNTSVFTSIDNMKNFEKVCIGWFCCNYKNISFNNADDIIHIDKEYYLKKLPIGFMVDCYDIYSNRGRLVDYERKCPRELYLTDFKTKENIDRLVKLRKRTYSDIHRNK